MGIFQVEIKIKLSNTLCKLDRYDEAQELMGTVKDRHYGFLPAICSELAYVAIAKGDNETAISLFKEVLPIIEAGNFSRVQYFYDLYHCSTLAALTMGELNIANEALSRLHSYRNKPRFLMQRTEAYYHLKIGNFSEALEIFTELQKDIALGRGIQDRTVVECHLRRAECLIMLKNKTMAKKCIREAKKLSDLHPDATFSERVQSAMDYMDGMVDNEQKQQKFPFEILMKCSNPVCASVEEIEKEFQVCAKCRATRYCSRKCQRKHWKLGHKKSLL